MEKNIKIISVLFLWIVGIGAALQFAKIAVPFSQLQTFYPQTQASFGWVLSIISLVGAVFGFFAGHLTGRFGGRNILIAGILLGAAMSLLQSIMPGLPVLLASRFLEGFSHLAIVVAAPTLINQISSEKYQGAAMALWSTFFGVAFAAMGWVGLPWVMDHGVQALFRSHGYVMLCLAVLSYVLLPARLNKGQTDRADGVSLFSGYWAAFRTAPIIAPGLGWLFYALTYVSILAVLPDLLGRDYVASAAVVLPLIGIATSLCLVPILLARFSVVVVIICGFTASAVMMLSLIWFENSLIPILFVFASLGLVQGGSFAAVPTLNQKEEDQALSYGFMAQFGNIGNLFGTPFLLYTLTNGGQVGLYIVISILYLLAALFHLLLSR